MKLVRFGEKGSERPGIIDENGAIRDLGDKVPDFMDDDISIEAIEIIRGFDISSLPVVADGVRRGSVIKRCRNFIAIGLNYEDHAYETGSPIPEEPVLFNKAPSCIVGPDDDVVLCNGSARTDWEIELAFVIGKRCDHVSKADALSHVSGFCICNDVSERFLQSGGTGQWVKGKSCPTYGPLGPWLVTPDEIGDVNNLDMALDIDGERMQTGNTRTMIFDVPTLIEYISNIMILESGDIITTGTPPGVGIGRKPKVYLKPGQTMHLSIAGLGEQEQKVVSPS